MASSGAQVEASAAVPCSQQAFSAASPSVDPFQRHPEASHVSLLLDILDYIAIVAVLSVLVAFVGWVVMRGPQDR
jgi:hypothetical protein